MPNVQRNSESGYGQTKQKNIIASIETILTKSDAITDYLYDIQQVINRLTLPEPARDGISAESPIEIPWENSSIEDKLNKIKNRITSIESGISTIYNRLNNAI